LEIVTADLLPSESIAYLLNSDSYTADEKELQHKEEEITVAGNSIKKTKRKGS